MPQTHFPQQQAGLYLPSASEAATSGEPLEGSGFENEAPDDGRYPMDAEAEGQQHAG